MSAQVAAGNLLQRAVELDNKNRHTEALVCYQEGLQLLVGVLKEQVGEKRTYLRGKVEEYMNRAEQIKQLIQKLKNEGKFHEQICIENESTGHSYETVFGRFLDDDVQYVKVEDPYIRIHHQCQNLVRFAELLVKKCNNLKKIELITIEAGVEQHKWLQDIGLSLKEHSIQFVTTFSTTLHDRQISLNTGWIIKIGRGLDYFKAPSNKYSLGVFDLDFRRCQETTVDIFHSNNCLYWMYNQNW